MSGLENIVTLNALASGTVNVHVDKAPSATLSSATTARIAGTVTLSGNFNVSPSGTPVKNTSVKILWEASVTLSGNSVVIFGETVPDQLSTKNFIAECIYDGAAWVVNILPDFAGTGIVDSHELANDAVSTAKVADDAITNTKLANITRGSIKVGGASDAPTDLDAKTSGQILVGDGTDVVSVAVSGDATLSSVGALTIANSAVTTAKIDDGAVTPTKLSASARKSMVAIPVSFETAGEIGVVKYTMCFDCTVDGIEATVTKPAATDTATIIFKDHGGSVLTGSQVDITTGLVLGNIVSTIPTANNTFSAGEQITFETSKTTAGSGNCTVVLCLTHD
jgi:hypothetical protein